MGMRILSRTCSLTPPGSTTALPNPNPARFVIIRTQPVGCAVVVEVRYPDCVNYEGRKVLVFRNTTVGNIRRRTTLDPHFALHGGPFARFEPTDRGWRMAVEVAFLLNAKAQS